MTSQDRPRTIAIIQARFSSSRLPGKVLLDIAGQPMLARVVERARRARSLDGLLVATTTDPSDDPVEALCRERGYDCFRGSLHDVLDRYYQAAQRLQAQVIVRITADCPVIDPGLIDELLQAFLPRTGAAPGFPFDFAANRLPPPWGRTYPIGLDVEVCTFAALERAWREARELHHREHVMPYLYEQERSRHYFSLEECLRDHSLPSGFFRVLHLHHQPDYGSLRWTVDTPEDLELVRQVYARFTPRDDFTWREILQLFEREPALAEINAGVKHRTHLNVDERLAKGEQ